LLNGWAENGDGLFRPSFLKKVCAKGAFEAIKKSPNAFKIKAL
jgi:hypothetical protein